MLIRILGFIVLAAFLGIIYKGQHLKTAGKNKVTLSNTIQVAGWFGFCGGTVAAVCLLLDKNVVIKGIGEILGVIMIPFFCIGGVIAIFMYDGWYIQFDNDGFEYRSCLWKKYSFSYQEVIETKKKGNTVYIYTDEIIIKLPLQETVNNQFFLKHLSEEMNRRKLG